MAKRKLDKAEVKPSEKYAEKFKNDLLKHPEAYTVQTPRGEMTIAVPSITRAGNW